MKLRKNKRSLTTLKRTEPSAKEAALNDFVKMVIDGDIDVDSLIPDEEIPDSILAKYPTIASIMDEMSAQLTGEMEHDTEIMDIIMTKYGDHPQNVRLQMTILQTIAKQMTPEQKDELYKFATSKNAAELEPDNDLTNKIYETAEHLNQGRKTKGIKNLKACLRRIEDKHTPHEYNGRPVLSLDSIIEEKLFHDETPDENDNKFNYYQPPAPYSLAYQMYGETMMAEGNYMEAFEAFNNAISWNPVTPIPLLCTASMLIQLDDTARAVEFLEKAHPYITDPAHLLHLYMLYSGMMLNEAEASDEDVPAQAVLSVRLQRLAKYLTKSESDADFITSISEQFVEKPVAPISREAFIEELKAHNIPVGPSPKALEILNKAIQEVSDASLRESLEANYNKLQKCFDFEEI